MTAQNRLVRAIASTLGFLVVATAIVWAQGQTEPTPGSLGAVVTEIRQLRLAIEESTRSQTQIQALSVYLSSEQSRLIQVTNRLDAARRQLDDAIQQTAQATRALAMFHTDDAHSTPEEREEAAGLMKIFKPQADAAAAREQTLRANEAQLLQAYQAEEARWSELIARLEQSVKR